MTHSPMHHIAIVKQYQVSCQGEHVDPEYTLLNGEWTRTDRNGSGPIVEWVERHQGEDDTAFSRRVERRASELDRGLDCSQCYH